MAGSVLGTLAVRLRADTAEFAKDLKGAEASLTGVADTARKVAMAAGAAFATISGIGLIAVKIAADFESGMVRVKAIAQATDGEFAQLKSSATELATATQFTAREVAEGMSFMAMAGFKANEVIGTMPSVLSLASAGMIDLGDAANITTNILTGMGLEVDQLAMVNDVLVSAMTGANVDTRMLGEAFKFVGPVAKSAGVSFKDITASIALLGNAGIQGSTAGTTLRFAIASLLKPSKEASEIIKRLGLVTKDSSGKLLSMTGIVEQLETSGASTADILGLFGLRAGPGMAALIEQGSDKLKMFVARLDESGGVAERISKENLDTLTGRLKILASGFEAAAISIGDLLIPAAKSIVSMAQEVADRFNNLSDSTREWIVNIGVAATAIAGLVAGIAGAVAVAPILVAAFGTFVAALKGAAIAAAVLAPIVIGIAVGLGVASKEGESTADTLKRVFSAAGNVISDVWTNKISPFIDGLRMGFAPAVEAIGAAWDSIKQSILFAVGEIAKSMGMATDGIAVDWQLVGGVIGTIVGSAIEIIATLVSWIARIGALGGSSIILFGKVIVGWITEPISLAIQFAENLFDAFADIFSGSILQGLQKLGLAIFDFVLSPMRLILRQAIKIAEAFGAGGLIPNAVKKFATEGLTGFVFPDVEEGTKPERGRGRGGGGAGLSMPTLVAIPEVGEVVADAGNVIIEATEELSSSIITAAEQFENQLAATDIDIEDDIAAVGRTIGDAFSYAGNTLTDAIIAGSGTLGDVIEGAKAGAEGGGGWQGAILGAILALLQKTEFFAELIDMVNEVLEEVVGAFDSLLAPFTPLLDVIFNIVEVLIESIGSLLGLATSMSPLSHVISAVTGVFQIVLNLITPLIAILVLGAEEIAGMMQSILGFNKMVSALGTAATWVADTMSRIVNAIGHVWNRMIEKIAGWVENISGDLADSIRKAKMSLIDLAQAAGVGPTGGGVDPDVRDLNRNFGNLGNTVNALNESLTNIPEGFKVQAARYRAIDEGPAAGMGQAEADPSVGGTFNISVATTEEAADTIIEILEEKGYAKSGSRVPGSAWGVDTGGA